MTASGLPADSAYVDATFNETTGVFFWVGAFADSLENGRHEVTFMAGGESTLVVVGVTQFAITGFRLIDPLTGEPFPGGIISIPIFGQRSVLAQALCNPFGDGDTPFCGQGTNGWP